MEGVFDHDLTLKNASPNENRWPVPAGAKGKLKVATVAGTPTSVVLDFKPELGHSYVIDGGAGGTREFITLNDGIAPVDNVNGTWTCRLAGNAKVALDHAVDVTIEPVSTIDCTHATEQHVQAKIASAGWAAGKQRLIARAAAYAG
ncbi:MAG TPA: hypothetical protein VF649_06690 [Sphingomonas sp.]|uniref:hypothetical protein n=1 Tax=Sphingomonas sp. TaxID=28214 RepID=UPI002ED7B41D